MDSIFAIAESSSLMVWATCPETAIASAYTGSRGPDWRVVALVRNPLMGAFDRADLDERSTVTNPRSSNRATGCYVVVTAQPTRVAMAGMLEASRTVGRVSLRLLAAPSRLGARIARKLGGLPLAAPNEDRFTPVRAVRLGNRLSTPTPHPP